MIDFEGKGLQDELKAFHKGKVVYIWCIFNRDKIETFKTMIQGHKYKIRWIGECAEIKKEIENEK